MQTNTISKSAKKAKKKINAGITKLSDGVSEAVEQTEGAIFPEGFSFRRYASEHPIRIGITIGALGLLAVGFLRPRLRKG